MKNKKKSDIVGRTGWVYADLLLGIAVIFLVSMVGVTSNDLLSTAVSSPVATPTSNRIKTSTPSPTITPTPTTKPTETPTPTVTVTPSPSPQVGLEKRPVIASIETNVNQLLYSNSPVVRDKEEKQIKAQIREEFGMYDENSQAGIVLIFGTSPTALEGNKIARKVKDLLVEEMPDVFGDAVIRPFHNIQSDPAKRGEAIIEVYLLLNE